MVERPIVLDGAIADAGFDAGTAPVANDHFTHVGSTMCSGDPASGVPRDHVRKPNRPEIVLDAFDPATDEIVADLGAGEAPTRTSRPTQAATRSPHVCAFPFDALGLNWSTGSVTPTTQTVFRVE